MSINDEFWYDRDNEQNKRNKRVKWKPQDTLIEHTMIFHRTFIDYSAKNVEISIYAQYDG